MLAIIHALSNISPRTKSFNLLMPSNTPLISFHSTDTFSRVILCKRNFPNKNAVRRRGEVSQLIPRNLLLIQEKIHFTSCFGTLTPVQYLWSGFRETSRWDGAIIEKAFVLFWIKGLLRIPESLPQSISQSGLDG